MSTTERRAGAERRNEIRSVPGPTADLPTETMQTDPDAEMRTDRDAEMRTNNPDAEMPTTRDNPEVMGRTEPRPVEDRGSELWPDMTDYGRRFDQIQSDFIEDPKSAVQKAERLVEEAIDSMTRSMRERMKSMHPTTDGKADTEHMRMTMRAYRDFIQSLGGRRAA